MNSRAKTTFLTLALVFVGIAATLFAVTIYYASTTLYILYHDEATIGDVFGGLITWILVIMYGALTLVAAGGILPFDLLLMNKCKVKAWYTNLILIFAIVVMVLTIFTVLGLPLIGRLYYTLNNSSSSAISSSM